MRFISFTFFFCLPPKNLFQFAGFLIKKSYLFVWKNLPLFTCVFNIHKTFVIRKKKDTRMIIDILGEQWLMQVVDLDWYFCCCLIILFWVYFWYFFCLIILLWMCNLVYHYREECLTFKGIFMDINKLIFLIGNGRWCVPWYDYPCLIKTRGHDTYFKICTARSFS